ncbi:MAG: GntR family transcriptional regulator [Oscillospiraceae bacterium]|nr:GntR family transcriptional regulator [Oscillospiraceae bacterium]
MANMNQTTMVYEKLKDRIEKGYYSPSESLPEVELATEYNVSRNTVKKALLMLENDSYVTIEQNKGAKVRSYSKKEVLDYLEFRVELEGFITRLAVEHFTKKDLEKLEAIYAKMGQRREENDLMGYSALNQQFHATIYAACPNRMATDTLVHMKNQMRKYNAKTILVPGRDAHSYEEHGKILAAIRAGDAKEAEACIRHHVESVRKTFEDYYSLLF